MLCLYFREQIVRNININIFNNIVIGKDQNELFMLFFHYPDVDKITELISMALIIKATLEGKQRVIEDKPEDKKEDNSKKGKKEKENKKAKKGTKIPDNIITKFQREYPKIPESMEESNINPQDYALKKDLEVIQEKQNTLLLGKLEGIFNKYKNRYSEDDKDDLKFIFKELESKLKKK